MLRTTSSKIFVLTLLACAWFYSPGLWNQTARYDSIQALAEQGTFCIDDYLPDPEHNINTGDWAHAHGHYYSNKAPGTMFLGALVYAPIYWIERAILRHAPGPRLQAFNFWWVNFWCSAVPTALLAVVFYLLLKTTGLSQKRSLFWALALVFATPLWPYAGAMWGHNLAALLLASAFFHAGHVAPRTEPPPRTEPIETKHSSFLIPHSSVLVGLFAGLAVVTDYLAIAAIPCFALYFLCQKRWRDFLHFALGGILPLFLFCFYHWKCFGNPFLPATFFNNPGFLDAAAAGGIVTGFNTNVLVRLLIGMPHGLFWCAPLCVFAIPGACALWRHGGEQRALAILAGGWFLISLALNASFNGWHGGSGIGPRYLLPAFPAWAFLAAAAPMRERWQRIPAVALWLLATANMLVVASLSPLASEALFNPYTTYWARFLNGFRGLPVFARVVQPYSLGRLLGFQPWSDVVLLLGVAFLAARKEGQCCWTHKKHEGRAGARPSLAFVLKNWPILLALALLFALPSYIGLMGDEAMLQAHAFESNRMLTWAKTGLVGSVGQAYGPIAIWFYQILQMITPNPIHIVMLKTLIVGLSSLALLRYLARRMVIPERLPMLLFLLAPYCWHWTRCLWDNVFQLPLELASITALVAYLDDECPARRRTLLLGTSALCGILAVWLHTMALPFLATLPVFLLVARRDVLRRDWKRILGVAIAGSVLLGLILVPRFIQTRQAFAQQDTFNRTAKVSVWQGTKNALGFPALLSSATFEDDQMTAPISDFPGLWKPLWRTLGYAMLAVTICLLVAGVVTTWQLRREPDGQVGVFAIINIVMQMLFVLATRLQFFPHYHQPVLISSLLLAAIGASSLIDWKRGRIVWHIWCALGTASILVFLSHLALTGGQDRPPYGMTLAQQWPAIRTIQRHVQNGESLHVVANTWQYSTIPVCLGILNNLAQTDLAGRKSPNYSGNMPGQTWVLVNPVDGCGFLRIADTTNPTAPRDVPVEQ
ncbi:MAG: hypothetical protein J5654_12705 [Victivallales bacterium]|nr:hypothetical protein [Victivallales bacterium]